ncbi:hypothetical protein PIB30_059909 [Stylosanthes scabra]|uniref:Uncharacterized protein n=1 Tax=Stylosanthes scabra TaxID=79078 RepID=A0ABU6SLS3_9FABA|nr:hypothetical protein [Stylosanthes scabra]
MFPRLHVKDAEKGGPKPPPRNKMAIYEQFNINNMPSQNNNYYPSPSSTLFPLHLRSYTPPSISTHVGSSQSIQFCTSTSPSILAENIQAFNSKNINLTKFMSDDFIHTKCSLKAFDVEEKNDEDKVPLKSLNSFKEKVSSLVTIELNSTQYEKNQIEEENHQKSEEDEETYKHYSSDLNKPSFECKLRMDITPNDVLGVIGEKQFWKARTTMINQQRIFIMQVFELHRLIEVQKLIARSPYVLLEDNLALNRTLLTSKLPVVKLDNKLSEKQSSGGGDGGGDHYENNAIGGKIPLPPCINNISKGHFNNNHGHYIGNPTLLTSLDSKNTLSCVYPPQLQGNQWLVPVMSPLEGLVYKPIIGPCPTNPSLMPPTTIYGPYSSPKHVQEVTTLNPPPTNSHQRIGSLSDCSSSLPYFSPPMMQPNNDNNQSSLGERSTTTTTSSNSSNSSGPCKKKMKGDVLPLFPVAPTFWPSNLDLHHHHQPKVIKALPHNPKSATESAARIFRSMQEERKYL